MAVTLDYYDRREESISRSCEGSDIVFENLLGDLTTRQSTDGKPTRNGTDIQSDDFECIFDDDLFEVSKDEMEQQMVFILTDVDDEEEESESVEGVPDLTTSPIKPPKLNVFDSILLDLDEKTKEMEKQQMTRAQSTKKKRKRRHKKHKNRSGKEAHSPADIMDAARPLICCQNEGDIKMLDRDDGGHGDGDGDGDEDRGSTLNPWRLRHWEFDQHHHRRTLRTLLSTLNGDILWDGMEWEAVRMKDIVYDRDCFAVFDRARSLFHCDKSRARGDDIEQQIICEWIYQALLRAHDVMTAKLASK